MKFASGPYNRMRRTLRLASRPPRPRRQQRNGAIDPDSKRPHLVAGRGLVRRRLERDEWPWFARALVAVAVLVLAWGLLLAVA